ncbi:mediator complex subunit 13 C-terminal-domain-containing protein [Xylogone sp. PMI_703]|nr:mediator complex subunit 13 C-terminal-domain-containing protein [Xylogone sp. PMI_703]
MEPGDYLTNALSVTSYSSIQYEYLELSSPSRLARQQLNQAERAWHEEGALVYRDQLRDGIWMFRSIANSNKGLAGESAIVASPNLVEIRGITLSVKDRGVYEPASLVKGRSTIMTNFSSLTPTSSPSSSLEGSGRNAHILNAKAAQTNPQNPVNEAFSSSPATTSGISPDIQSLTMKDMHALFISAVLSSVTYFLCRDCDFIPLNSRTFAMRSLSHTDLTTVLATIDVSLTSLGSLVVKAYSERAFGIESMQTSINPSGSLLTTPDNLPTGAPLWLGPTGNPARFHSLLDEKQIRGNSSIQTQISPSGQSFCEPDFVSISTWRSECLEWLSVKGLDPSRVEKKGWIMVQILRQDSPHFTRHYTGVPSNEDVSIIPWPVALCFRVSNMETPGLAPWKTQLSSRSPLSFAEEWFSNQDARASAKSKRQKEKQINEVSSKERMENDLRAQPITSHSPANLRRSSNAGAVYPTPPDGVSHPVGATPSFDGTISSPGNANQLFANEADAAAPTNPGVAEAEAGNWPSSESKERINPNLNFNDNENDDDNLFGDMEGDLFADAAVTDADFNFFDDPGGANIDQGSGSSGVDMDVVFHEDSNTDQARPANNITAEREQHDTLMEDLNEMASIGHHGNKLPPSQSGAEETDTNQDIHKSNTLGVSLPPPPSVVSPPFNMTTIFQRFFADPKDIPRVSIQQPRRTSIFKKLEFESSLKSVNKKYELNGRFDYPENDQKKQPFHLSDLPRTDYLSRQRRISSEEHNTHDVSEPQILKTITKEVDGSDAQDIGSPTDSEVSSRISDQDYVGRATDFSTFNLAPGIKRKRNIEDEEQDDITSSLGALIVDYDQSLGSPGSLGGLNFYVFASDPGDWPLGPYFSIPGPESQYRPTLSDSDYIATAQIIADQAISGTFKLPQDNKSQLEKYCTELNTVRDLAQCLVQAAKLCLDKVTACSLSSFLEIQGIPVLAQGIRVQPRPIPGTRAVQTPESSRFRNLFSLPPPELEVQRSDSKLTILPPAVNFWETLGLSPSEGGKDVAALCVYPNLDGILDAANTFLNEMRSVYESYKLGTHDRIASKEAADGLVSFDAELCHRSSETLNFGDLKEITLRISRILSTVSAEGSSRKNLVVYFVYPVDNQSLLMHICASFKLLFDFYRKALAERKLIASNELVLQLIPLDLVASPTSIRIPSPTEYVRLAMQVYDRCINFASASSPPAILLDQPLPKSIDFKLSTSQSASVLQENTCLHVAYAQSIDDRWITAAWTDNRGNRQMTSSYCLGRRHEIFSRTFSEIANEIWQTTLDVVLQKKINWRIMIVKAGTMDQTEVDCWINLAASSDAQVSLTLLTAKSEPSLQLMPTPSTLQPPTHISQAVITPASTPQTMSTSIVSPENLHTTDPSAGPDNLQVSDTLTASSETGTNSYVSANDSAAPFQMSGISSGNAAVLQNAISSPENAGTPTRDTPGSVPTPAVDSPVNPGTPGDISSEPDIEARIIDYTDESWGAILSHRLNNSNSLLDLNLALISGYIIKRGGTSNDDPPVLLEVNIIHSDIVGNTRTFYEGLLREIIGYYRGLSTLARARGVIDPVKDGRPWHIAAAEKAVKALYLLL